MFGRQLIPWICGEDLGHYLGLVGKCMPLDIHFVGQMILRRPGPICDLKTLELSYPLANLDAAVATMFRRRRVVFIVFRVWSVLSAVLECVEVGAGVVLDVLALFLVCHFGTVELSGPSRPRGCCTGDIVKALLRMFAVTLRLKHLLSSTSFLFP